MPRPDSQPAPTAAPPRRRRRWGRRLLLAAGIATPVLILALWVLVNRVEWLGPYVADGLRAVVGVDNVARLEDFAYGVQDRVNRVLRRGEAPKAYWEVPSASPPQGPSTQAPEPVARTERGAETPDDDEPEPIPPFQPKDVGPALESWSAPGDGKWLPMPDARNPERAPVMFKTLLHPDKNRSWAEVFVVALDLQRVDIHLVPGSKEPEATVDSAKDIERPGVIPEKDRARTMAAFNGGFKTEHGAYGMSVGGVTLVPPKAGVCALARFADGRVTVAPWESIAKDAEGALWWRQTPNCMVEQGELHARLRDEQLAKKWGATLDGETVIRRSAAGISADGKTLFVSISNNTTARTIAEGVRHAGAVTVAQLDVNFSYPKFVTFERKQELEEGEKPKWVATALAEGFEFSEDEYIRKKSRRDFFYVVAKTPDRRTARTGNSAD